MGIAFVKLYNDKPSNDNNRLEELTNDLKMKQQEVDQMRVHLDHFVLW